MTKKILTLKRTLKKPKEKEVDIDVSTEKLPRPARKRRGQRIIVNPDAKRRKKVVKKAVKKIVKQPPQKKKKKKEPPKKQRRPLRVKIVRPVSPTDVGAKELDMRLTERYDVWRNFQPLEIGIDVEVLALITKEKWGYSKRIMRKAFKLHVRNMRYRENIAKGGKRYNLNNEAVDDVHEFSMAYARVYVDRRASRIVREKALIENMENVIAADRLKAQEVESHRLSL